MLPNYPNIYPVVIFNLHNRVRGFLKDLNTAGQIDLDENGYPYLISIDRNGANTIGKISRNNKVESFVINTRRQQEPETTWNTGDGFNRQTRGGAEVAPENPQTGERAKRSAVSEAYQNLANQCIES